MLKKVIYIVIILFILVSCSSNETRQNEKAIESGRVHALRFIEAQPMSDMELQNCLIEVRCNETKLRHAGYEEAASKYIETFESTVRQESDSLAKIVF